MIKVLKMAQTLYACPSIWELDLGGGVVLSVSHRLHVQKGMGHSGPDYYVYLSGTGLSEDTFIRDSEKAIKDVLGNIFDFSKTEVIPAPDPNEGYNIEIDDIQWRRERRRDPLTKEEREKALDELAKIWETTPEELDAYKAESAFWDATIGDGLE